MAIRLMKGLPAAELVGKFMCTPSILHEQEYGYPAIIERATNSQLVYRRLTRGEWDPVEKEWHVNPDPDAEGDNDIEGSRKCNRTSIRYVCDTAVEAISLYTQATLVRKAIERFRKEQLEGLEALIGQGQLPLPAYLGVA